MPPASTISTAFAEHARAPGPSPHRRAWLRSAEDARGATLGQPSIAAPRERREERAEVRSSSREVAAFWLRGTDRTERACRPTQQLAGDEREARRAGGQLL